MGISDASELERVATAALERDDSLGRPVAVRAWIDASAILIVARCKGGRAPSGGRSSVAAVAKLQHDVAAAFYLSTGELLRPCGRSSDPERSLLVLAFERVDAETLEAHRSAGGRAPLADAS